MGFYHLLSMVGGLVGFYMKIALAQYGGRAGGILTSLSSVWWEGWWDEDCLSSVWWEGWWDFTICHEDCLSSVWWGAGGILPSVILPSVMKIALAQYGGGLVGFYHLS